MSYIKHGHDNWTICDSCGFQMRRSEARKTWDGKVVHAATCWDEKYPRTGVTIPSIIKTVADPRPQRSAEAGTTTLAATSEAWSKTIQVTSLAGMLYLGDLGIVLDNGTTHWSHITSSVATTTLTIDDALPSTATAGNTVYVAGLCGETFTGKIGPEDL